jgi:uncharacterized repeat protein (TIGR01451 family)
MKHSFRLPLPLAAGLIAIACALVGQGQALAATAVWYVSPGGNDSNSCAAATAPCLTINGAISKASAGDTVDVAVGTYTGSGTNVVAIDKDLTLSGGWNSTFTQQTGLSTIDGQNAHRGVFVASTATATVTRFEVMNGAPPPSPDPFAFGGGVLTYGPLTLDQSYIHDNVEDGVETTGAPLTITNSTVSGNQSGVVLYNLFGNFTITITNSTIANNTGSGINLAILGGSSSSVLTLNFDSITANSSTDINSGGGISAYSGWDIQLENTIVSGNTAPFFPDIFVGPDSSVTSGGYNIGSGFSHTATDMYGDPVLGSLADNGGPTPTMALLSGSPAIDAIPPAVNGCGTTITTDQRGVSRPQGPGCDIGAFELVPPSGADLSITKSGAPNPVVSGNRLTYMVSVTNNGPQDATGVTLTDALPASLHFNSVSSSQGTCTRSTATNPQPKGGTVTCTVGDLANGGKASITIVVTTTTPGTLTNTARVSGNETDPDSSNNSASVTTTVLGT